MKKHCVTLLVICFIFFACGVSGTGNSDTGPAGDTAAVGGGSHIGPIVDTGSMPSGETSGSISDSCYSPLVNPADQELKLAIVAVENARSGVDLPRQYFEKNPLEIYTGFAHLWGYPGPEELQTRLLFQVSYDAGELATPDLCLRVWTLEGFHDVANESPSVDMIYNSYGDFEFAGTNEAEEDFLPALFKDAKAPGYFDRPDWTAFGIFDHTDSVTLVVQAIILKGHLPGGEMKHFASNYVFFTVRTGVPND